MIKFTCGCISTNIGMKISWCKKHITSDVHQTEDYYH
jgi:hypothetical protein